MDINLGIWNLPWSHFTWEEGLAGVRASGFDTVCLYPKHKDGDIYTDETTPQQGEALKQRLDDAGVSCVMIMAARPDTAGVDAAKRRIDMAAAMGVPYLCSTGTWTWVKFLEEPKPNDQIRAEHEAFVKGWREVMSHAEAADVVVTLKPHGGNSATGEILKNTLDDVGSSHFQACLDAGNVRFYEGVDPIADIDPVLGHARTLCLKDHSGPMGHADFPIIGDGGVDHTALLHKLNDAGYTGPMVIERFDGAAGRTGIDFDTVCQRARISRKNILRMAASVG